MILLLTQRQFPNVDATLRWPAPGGSTSDELTQHKKLADLLTGEKPQSWLKKGKNMTERVRYLLQSYDSFGPISSNYFWTEQGFTNWGSLEDVHNALHDYIGGNGHMGDPAIAVFDPIFWLHHW